jgi:glutamate synthase (NADPH/NADH) large chain
MTGGIVIVLGKTGRNFAAGMSGGVAYVLDEEGHFEHHCNMSMVQLESIQSEAEAVESGEKVRVHFNHLGKADEHILREFIENHLRHTGSVRARTLLENWATTLPKFIKVMPTEYRRALQEIAAQQANQKEVA